ncbi:hypothetical protein J6590_066405 [Homalodisca vitripennis]|nr:hypothetical protein J6590_066405 [Homalodisca vitripennis]
MIERFQRSGSNTFPTLFQTTRQFRERERIDVEAWLHVSAIHECPTAPFRPPSAVSARGPAMAREPRITFSNQLTTSFMNNLNNFTSEIQPSIPNPIKQ